MKKVISFLDVVWRVAAIFVIPPFIVYCVANIVMWIIHNWITSTANYTSY